MQMAANFKLFLHKSSDSIHLKMFGDFDGSSAHELLQAIQNSATRSFQVFVDTENLNHIYAFGKDVFQNNLRIVNKQSNNIIFIGKNKNCFRI
jgi:hypothetical protein